MGFVSCPALGNEKVYFRQNGFKHLLYKGRKNRKMPDVIRRLKLLPRVKSIVMNRNVSVRYRCVGDKGSFCHFWSLMFVYNLQKITVIIRQINDGSKHFYSVF